jgi:hypothetical protein
VHIGSAHLRFIVVVARRHHNKLYLTCLQSVVDFQHKDQWNEMKGLPLSFEFLSQSDVFIFV